jgi:hypothetical protein
MSATELSDTCVDEGYQEIRQQVVNILSKNILSKKGTLW